MRRPVRSAVTTCLLVILLVGVVGPASRGPVHAYEGDHFIWTYYLALHVGYTKRQAYQIASAAYAVDWDPDTGPMEAQPLDVLWGAEHPGLWKLQGAPSTKVAGIWRRFHAFADVTHCVITQQEQDLLKWLNPDAQVRARFPVSTGAPPPLGPMLVDITPPALPAIVSDIFRVVPLCGPADLAAIAAARGQAREELWALARRQRNPGPLIHFVQDTYAHGDYTAVRGHALVGHVPDYLGADMAKALAMTTDTIQVLRQFMSEVLGQTPNQPDMQVIHAALNMVAGSSVVPDGSSLWFNWSTWDPGASPTLTSLLQKVSVLAGSPSLEASLDVVRRLVANDERAGRLPTAFPNGSDLGVPLGFEASTYVDAAAPSTWIPFRFNLGGNIVAPVGAPTPGDPRYAVENVTVTFGQPAVTHRAVGRDRVRATLSFPFRLANAPMLSGRSGSYLSPLPVLETVKEASGAGVPQQRMERREEGEHAITTTIERSVADLERAVVWDVVVHPYGLNPVRQQVPVRVNMTCDAMPQVAPDVERLRGLAGGIDAVASTRRSVRQRVLSSELPEIEKTGATAEAYLRQVEGVYDQLFAACRAASVVESQLDQSRRTLDQWVQDAIALRATALSLSATACEIAGRIAASTSPDGRANLANNAAGFARQTQLKADELRAGADQVRSLHANMERAIQQAGLRDLVERDRKREEALAWLAGTVSAMREALSRAERAISDLPDPQAEVERLATGITTRLNSCLRTTTVRALEEEVARLAARVREVMRSPDLDLGDVPPLADWTRQRIAALDAAVTSSRIQQPSCRGAAMLMARLEPQPRDLSATVETIDLYARNAQEAASTAAACAVDTPRSAPTPRAPAPGAKVFRIVETRVEPQLINAPPSMTKVYPGLRTSFDVGGTVGAVKAAGRMTVTVPDAFSDINEPFTIAAVATGQWTLSAPVFQWIAVNLNVLGRGENQTTGQEMNPPGSYTRDAKVSVTTTLAESAGQWEADGKIYRELRAGFGVAFAEYGVLVKFIYAADK